MNNCKSIVISNKLLKTDKQIGLYDTNHKIETLIHLINFCIKNYDHMQKNIISNNKKILTLVSHNFTFANDIIQGIDFTKIKVYIDMWHSKLHNISDLCAKISDIVFCEWCLANAIYYSRIIKKTTRLILRIHRFEITKPYLSYINFNKVDEIITINSYIKNLLNKTFKCPIDKITEIPLNTPIPEILIAKEIKYDLKKKNLCMIGTNHKYLKRIDIVLKIFKKIQNHSNNYFNLYLIGSKKSELYSLDNNIKNMLCNIKNITIIDFLPRNKLFEKYNEMGYIFSVSDVEGCHTSVSEGLAFGVIPLIYRWYGSDLYYPEKYIHYNSEQIINFIINSQDNFKKLSLEACKFYKNIYKKNFLTLTLSNLSFPGINLDKHFLQGKYKKISTFIKNKSITN